MRERLRRGIKREVARLRKDGRASGLWALRITVAAVASYVVATLLFPSALPLLAPLTGMLVVQVTPVSLLASGFERVVAVVIGVSLAVVFAEIVPLEWWSLGVLIFVSITIGQVLRLRSNLIEVAISGMLVLGVGSLAAQPAAGQRIAETLVGAAVGMAVNLLFPPKVASADAGRAIDGLADSISELLTRAADELAEIVAEGRDVAPAAMAWLDDARRITHDIPQVGAALLQAEEGRRLNVRAVGTPNVGPGLRQGLESLEHTAVTIRGMLRAVVDATSDPAWVDEESREDLLLGLAQTLREMAAGIDAFGQLVRDEAGPARRIEAPADVEALDVARDGLPRGACPARRPAHDRRGSRHGRAARRRTLKRQAAAPRDGPRRADAQAGPADASTPPATPARPWLRAQRPTHFAGAVAGRGDAAVADQPGPPGEAT